MIFFWEKVQRLREADGVDIDPPVLPRRRKAPKRLEVGCGEPYYPQSPKDMYRRFYFEALDLVISAINNRFDQPGYQTYKNLQELLLQAARGQDYHKEFEYVVDFYGDEFESSQLALSCSIYPLISKAVVLSSQPFLLKMFGTTCSHCPKLSAAFTPK